MIVRLPVWHGRGDTPCIAFRHLPPNSARFGYATEGTLDLHLRAADHSALLTTDAVGALQTFWVLISL